MDELENDSLSLLLILDDDLFPQFLEWSSTQGLADLVLYLLEADFLRFKSNENFDPAFDQTGVFQPFYLIERDSNKFFTKLLSQDQIFCLTRLVHSLIPLNCVYAQISDLVWNEVLSLGRNIINSSMWPSVRRAITDGTKIPLDTILQDVVKRKYFERYLQSDPADLACLQCWVLVRRVLENVGKFSVAEGDRYLNSESFDGQKESAGKSSFMRRWRASSTAIKSANKTLKTGSGSATTNSKTSPVNPHGSKPDSDQQNKYSDPIEAYRILLEGTRMIQKQFFPNVSTSNVVTPSNASRHKSIGSIIKGFSAKGPEGPKMTPRNNTNVKNFCAGISEALRMELSASLALNSSVRTRDIDTVDQAFAFACAQMLEHLLQTLENEAIEYISTLYQPFTLSYDYAYMIANENGFNCPRIASYQKKLGFLFDSVRVEKFISWVDNTSQGRMYISYEKPQNSENEDDESLFTLDNSTFRGKIQLNENPDLFLDDLPKPTPLPPVPKKKTDADLIYSKQIVLDDDLDALVEPSPESTKPKLEPIKTNSETLKPPRISPIPDEKPKVPKVEIKKENEFSNTTAVNIELFFPEKEIGKPVVPLLHSLALWSQGKTNISKRNAGIAVSSHSADSLSISDNSKNNSPKLTGAEKNFSIDDIDNASDYSSLYGDEVQNFERSVDIEEMIDKTTIAGLSYEDVILTGNDAPLETDSPISTLHSRVVPQLGRANSMNRSMLTKNSDFCGTEIEELSPLGMEFLQVALLQHVFLDPKLISSGQKAPSFQRLVASLGLTLASIHETPQEFTDKFSTDAEERFTFISNFKGLQNLFELIYMNSPPKDGSEAQSFLNSFLHPSNSYSEDSLFKDNKISFQVAIHIKSEAVKSQTIQNAMKERLNFTEEINSFINQSDFDFNETKKNIKFSSIVHIGLAFTPIQEKHSMFSLLRLISQKVCYITSDGNSKTAHTAKVLPSTPNLRQFMAAENIKNPLKSLENLRFCSLPSIFYVDDYKTQYSVLFRPTPFDEKITAENGLNETLYDLYLGTDPTSLHGAEIDENPTFSENPTFPDSKSVKTQSPLPLHSQKINPVSRDECDSLNEEFLVSGNVSPLTLLNHHENVGGKIQVESSQVCSKMGPITKHLGLCDFSLCSILSSLSTRLVLQILMLVLCDKPLVLLSSSSTLFSKLQLVLPRLIWPFRMSACHVWVQLLSNSELERFLLRFGKTSHSAASSPKKPGELKRTNSASSSIMKVMKRISSGKFSDASDFSDSETSVNSKTSTELNSTSIHEKTKEKSLIICLEAKVFYSATNYTKTMLQQLRSKENPFTVIDLDAGFVWNSRMDGQNQNPTENPSKLSNEHIFKTANTDTLRNLVREVFHCCDDYMAFLKDCTRASAYGGVNDIPIPSSSEIAEATILSNLEIERCFYGFWCETLLKNLPGFIQHFPLPKVVSCDIRGLLTTLCGQDSVTIAQRGNPNENTMNMGIKNFNENYTSNNANDIIYTTAGPITRQDLKDMKIAEFIAFYKDNLVGGSTSTDSLLNMFYNEFLAEESVVFKDLITRHCKIIDNWRF